MMERLTVQVHPLFLDKKMATLFANTLKAPYYEHVMNMLNDAEIWLSKYIPYSWIKRWLPCLLIPLKHPIMSM